MWTEPKPLIINTLNAQLCKWLNNSGFLPRYGIILSYVRTQLCSGTVWHLCTAALLSSTACKLGKSKAYRKAYRNVTSHGSTLSLLSITPLSPAQLPSCVLYFALTPGSQEERNCTDSLLGWHTPRLAVVGQQDCGILNSRESLSRSMPIARYSCTEGKNAAQSERITVGKWTLIPQSPSQPI